MKKKFSILIDIAVICLCICALAIGVYSATTAQLTVSGSIGFTAHNCELLVQISKQGHAREDLTQYYKDEQYIDLSPNNDLPSNYSEFPNAGILGGNNPTFNGNVDLGTMNFTDLAEDTIPPIIVKVTVTNISAYPVSGFVMVNVPENSNITYTRQHSLGSSTTLNDHESALILNKDASATFVITFKVANPDQSISPEKAITITGDFAKYDRSKVTTVNDTATNLIYTPTATTTSAYYTVKPISKNASTSVEIPASYNHIPVTQIASSAFSSDTTITSIKIPDTVTTIGNSAFNGCTNLSSVKMSNVTKTIEQFAFNKCSSLTEIYIPSSVSAIMIFAFSDCKGLEKVKISSLTSWCNIDFGPTSSTSNPLMYARKLYINDILLTNLTLPKDLTEIKTYTFYNCESLIGTLNIPDSVTKIGDSAFSSCYGLTGNLTIPDSVTRIGHSAFSSCVGLTGDLTIGDSVTSIGSNAFNNCVGLTGDLTIGNSVTSIGASAFYGCININSVHIKDIEAWCKITFTNSSANPLSNGPDLYLNNEKVTNLIIPNSISAIKAYAFYNCTTLINVIIQDGVTSIGTQAFYFCSNIVSVTIGKDINTIDSQAFSACYKLVQIIDNSTALSFEAGSTNYGYIADNAVEIVTPEDKSNIVTDSNGFMIYDNTILVGYIGEQTKIIIPEGITQINEYVFYKNYNMTSITIPKSLTTILSGAFGFCYKLVQIIDNSTALSFKVGDYGPGGLGEFAVEVLTPGVESNIVTDSNGFIIYDNTTLVGYIGNKADIIIPEGIININQYTFYNNNKITSVTIPNSVTSIGKNAFEKCCNLTRLIIPDNVTSIGSEAFYECSNLACVTIGTEVTQIGSRAFQNCSKLKTVINKSTHITVTKESTANGYVGYYATNITNPS